MIRVLVVEDEPVAAAAHAEYVRRVEGFEVIAVARTAAEAIRVLRGPHGEDDAGVHEPVDLVLLDMHLPDRHGLDVVRAMRAAGHPADVLAVTSARDLAVVRSAVSQGIVQYLLKPFAFPALRERLEQYARYRDQLAGAQRATTQEDVDRTLAVLRSAPTVALPKGVTASTLDAVLARLRKGAASAQEVADHLGTSRVTARRYLEHLCDTGGAERQPRYGGGGGRPELEYRLTGVPVHRK